MKKSLAIFAAFSLALSAGAVAFARAETKPTCPIMKSSVDKPDPKMATVYKGKTFYYCCPGCKPAFEKMSDKEKVALMKYGVDTKKPAAKKSAPVKSKETKKAV